MPLEIRELHIKVNVNQPPQDNTGAAATSTPDKAAADKDALINQCVEEVMNILQQKEER